MYGLFVGRRNHVRERKICRRGDWQEVINCSLCLSLITRLSLIDLSADGVESVTEIDFAA